jgi:hypothetical protein
MSAALLPRLTDAQCDQFAAQVFRNMGRAAPGFETANDLREQVRSVAAEYSAEAECLPSDALLPLLMLHAVNQATAAPDMLAALKYVRDCIEAGNEPGMGMVHRAIAKTEGGAA